MSSPRTKLSAEHLVSLFIDEDTWVEFMKDASDSTGDRDRLDKGDGVLCGTGRFEGRQVCLYIQDPDVLFGTIGELHGIKVVRTIQFAIENRCPVIGIIQTGGARIQQGAVSLGAASAMANKLIEASGYIPTIAIVNGAGAGGGAYMTALSDFAIMNTQDAYMFLTGPKVVKKMLNETVTGQELGGIEAHFGHSGLVTHKSNNILEAKEIAHRLLEHLPAWYAAPIIPSCYETSSADHRKKLDDILKGPSQQTYEMEVILNQLLDKDSLFEQNGGYAKNAITAFGKLGGKSVGIVANQPSCMGGVLDVRCTKKIGRFVQVCDAYNIPLLFVVDCPGYLPGKDQEWSGAIGSGAFMAHLISKATTPRITLIVRKAIGGAYATLNSKHLGCDLSLAWTSAEIAVVGMDAALDVLLNKTIVNQSDKEKLVEEARKDYEVKHLNPYFAASRGLIDKVISPSESRIELIKAFKRLENKIQKPAIKKKGGILPLT